jgi:myo-inositol-1(or 4)-monophosphatase
MTARASVQMQIDPSYAERFAIDLAQEAGQLLLNHFGAKSFRFKDDDSLETEADLEADRLIYARVNETFPHAKCVSEERVKARDSIQAPEGLLWIWDPLDGTTNFVNGHPIWGVSLALLENLTPVVGVIHIPILKETISAVSGKGARCNGRRIQVCETDGKQFSDIYTFCSWRSHQFSSHLPGNIRAFGSTAYHSAQVACGRTAGSWEMSARIWDIAAGILIVREAGGVVSLVDGHDPLDRLRRTPDIQQEILPSILASSLSVHELMRQDIISTGYDKKS